MGMLFRFIFSIILIAVALFVAFWAIRHFMNIAEQGKILQFKEDFEYKVNSIWTSTYEVDTPFEFTTSPKIKWICFGDGTATTCIDPPGIDELCLEDRFCAKNFCDEISSGMYDDYNLFLLPLGMAERYNAYSTFMITCKGKNCLNFTNAECISVKDGKVRINFKKTDELPGKVIVSAPA